MRNKRPKSGTSGEFDDIDELGMPTHPLGSPEELGLREITEKIPAHELLSPKSLPLDEIASEVESAITKTTKPVQETKKLEFNWSNKHPLKFTGYLNGKRQYELLTEVSTLEFQLEEKDKQTTLKVMEGILQQGATFLLAFRNISTISNKEKEELLYCAIEGIIKKIDERRYKDEDRNENAWKLFKALKRCVETIELLDEKPNDKPDLKNTKNLLLNNGENANFIERAESCMLETSDIKPEDLKNPQKISALILERGGIIMQLKGIEEKHKTAAIQHAISTLSPDEPEKTINVLDAIDELKTTDLAKALLSKLIETSSPKHHAALLQLIELTNEKGLINEEERTQLIINVLTKSIQNGKKEINALYSTLELIEVVGSEGLISTEYTNILKKAAIRERVDEIFKLTQENPKSEDLLTENLEELQELRNKKLLTALGFGVFVTNLIVIFIKAVNKKHKNSKQAKELSTGDFQELGDLLSDLNSPKGIRIKEIYVEAYGHELAQIGAQNETFEIEKAQKQIQATQERVQKMQNSKSALEEKLLGLQKQEEELTSNARDLESKLEETEKEITRKEQTKLSLEAQIEKADMLKGNRNDDISKLQQQLKESETLREALRAKKRNLSEELKQMQIENKELTRQIEKLYDTIFESDLQNAALEGLIDTTTQTHNTDQMALARLTSAETIPTTYNSENQAALADTIPTTATINTPTTTRPPLSEEPPEINHLIKWIKTEGGLETLEGNTAEEQRWATEARISKALHDLFENNEFSFKTQEEVYFALVSLENLIEAKILTENEFKVAALLSCIEALALYSKEETESEVEKQRSKILSKWAKEIEGKSKEDIEKYIKETEEEIEKLKNDPYITQWETKYEHTVARIFKETLRKIANKWENPINNSAAPAETKNPTPPTSEFNPKQEEIAKTVETLEIPKGIPIKKPIKAPTNSLIDLITSRTPEAKLPQPVTKTSTTTTPPTQPQPTQHPFPKYRTENPSNTVPEKAIRHAEIDAIAYALKMTPKEVKALEQASILYNAEEILWANQYNTIPTQTLKIKSTTRRAIEKLLTTAGLLGLITSSTFLNSSENNIPTTNPKTPETSNLLNKLNQQEKNGTWESHNSNPNPDKYITILKLVKNGKTTKIIAITSSTPNEVTFDILFETQN